MNRSALYIAALAAALAFLTLGSGLLAGRGADAGGPTFDVDTTDDDPAKSACTAAPDDCSLRGAITTANLSASHNQINLANGATYVLDEAGANEDANATGDLDVLQPITLAGNGSTIDANGIDRVMDLYPTVIIGTITLQDVTLTGGSAGLGGGLYVEGGTLNLDGVTVDDNQASVDGGGVWVGPASSLSAMSSTFSNNTAGADGGGIEMDEGSGTLMVMDSTFTGNTGRHGGGAFLDEAGAATFTDSTFSSNTALNDCGGQVCFPGAGAVGASDTASLTISGGSFNNNHADLSSGGAVSTLRTTTEISGTAFSGNTAFSGGAILVQEMTLTDATLENNTAEFGGGAYSSAGTISNTTFLGNHANIDGGALIMSADLAVDHSLFTGNSADSAGGAIAARHSTPSITNSTISGNTADIGGGIYRSPASSARTTQPQGEPPGPLNLTFVTIANNTAADGANIFAVGDAGEIRAKGTIIAEANGGPNCNTALTTQTFNVEDADTCGLHGVGDQVNADPDLEPLADNGGPTMTRALGPASAAIDAVDTCPPPDDDQRGTSRPQGNACDAGAFESAFAPTSTPTASPTESGTPSESPTITPTASPTPSGSPPAGQTVVWGNDNCSGPDMKDPPDPVDSLLTLRHDAGLGANTGDCPAMGEEVDVAAGSLHLWGDVDCSTEIDPVDSLKILRFDAGLSVAQEEGCPPMGSEVTLLE
jgi:CSLREA domain-containing protein